MADEGTATSAQSGEPKPATGCLVRLGWLAVGNMLLAIFVILIACGERWTLTAKDVGFWLILALALALRYLDWKKFSATTADGVPATLRDIWRWSAMLVTVWSALWVLAQTLALG